RRAAIGRANTLMGFSLAAQPDATGAETPETTETAVPQVPIELASPRATMRTFVESMVAYGASDENDSDALDRALSAIDFGTLDDRTRQAEDAARLINVLNKIGRVESIELPIEGPEDGSFVYFPRPANRAHGALVRLTETTQRIVLSRDERGVWRISRATVVGLTQLVRDFEEVTEVATNAAVVLPLADRIARSMPEDLKRVVAFGIEIWQVIGIVLIVFVGFLLDLLVRTLVRGAWTQFERSRGIAPDADTLKVSARPFGLLAAAGFWLVMLRFVGLPSTAYEVLLAAARIVLMGATVWSSYRVVDFLGEFLAARARQTETKLDDLLIPLLRKTLKVVVTAFGLIYVAAALDIEILPLLTGLGIGGLALGLAAKDSIENFFGSVAVILDSPFEVGDWVVVGDTEGTVENIGLRSTRVRTFYNSLVSVPNATLVRATVDNYGRRRYRRFKTMLNITYDTPPAKIEAFCEGIREIIRLHPYTRKDSYHVWLNRFGAHSLDILVYMFHETPDWATELRERQRFMLDVIRLADRLGVEFAFPTQRVELTNIDEAAPGSPLGKPSSGAERDAQAAGIEAARDLTENQPWNEIRPGPVGFSARGAREDRHGELDDGDES
ncbi:MAG: mechanosensitive ion channel family protein, partial [Planctomycetota bacterium]